MDAELIEYVGGAMCLALIGSGPSAECGLPTWQQLAEQILKLAESKSLSDQETEPIEDALSKGDYPLMFQRVMACKSLGKEFLYDNCRRLLTASTAEGSVYASITRLPFQAYFTTNFDDLLAKHLERARIAPIPISNTQQELAQVDIDALKGYLIKLHGDFDHEHSLVLTESQYDDLTYAPQFAYLRQFVQGYFLSRHFLIIGYSVRDPDIQSLLKQNARILKRLTPIYAFVANATKAEVDEWDRKYNIRVIPYPAAGGDHSCLATLLGNLADYIGTEPLQPRSRLGVELRVAQSLYMWYKFQSRPRQDLRLDAFRALLLSIAVQKMSTQHFVGRKELQQEFRAVTGITPRELEASVDAALRAACKDGLLVEREAGQTFEATQNTIDLVSNSKAQYDDLVNTFKRQIKIDFHAQYPDLNEVQLALVADVLLETVTNMFSERGIEVVNMVFAGQQPHVAGAAALFQMIFSGSRRLESRRIQYAFVRYATGLFSSPTANQERFLEYLSKAFVCIQTLGMDPDGSRFRREFLSNRTLIIDDNVLIPLLALEGSKQKYFDDLMTTAVRRGLLLAASQRSLDEVYAHLTWAQKIVTKNSGDPTEILRAALGHGAYRKNAFLDGWIRYAGENELVSFDNYLEIILGHQKWGYIEEKLQELYKIRILDFNTLAEANQEAFVVRDETENFISQKAEESNLFKSTERVQAEGEVYTYLYFWGELAPESADTSDWKSSFLSQGAFLNRVAADGPYPLRRPVVVSPEALYELLVRLGDVPVKFASFGEVLHSSYLYSADYFIDQKKYRRFFGSLINEAERIYAEGLNAYREHIDESLDADYLSRAEPLERPFVVDRLESELKTSLVEMERKYKLVVAEKEQLTRQLALEKAKTARETAKSERMKEYGARVTKAMRRRGKRGRKR